MSSRWACTGAPHQTVWQRARRRATTRVYSCFYSWDAMYRQHKRMRVGTFLTPDRNNAAHSPRTVRRRRCSAAPPRPSGRYSMLRFRSEHILRTRNVAFGAPGTCTPPHLNISQAPAVSGGSVTSSVLWHLRSAVEAPSRELRRASNSTTKSGTTHLRGPAARADCALR